MAERRPHLYAIGIALAALAVGCDESPNPLLLDTVCNSQFTNNGLPTEVEACVVSGDVEITTGVSDDVIGIHFGPSGVGELRIRLNAIAAVREETWNLHALAASTRPEGSTLFRSLTWGSCGAVCPADPPDVEAPVEEDFAWAQVVNDFAGAAFPETSTEGVPDDAAVIFRGMDVDLVDIATPGFEGTQDPFAGDDVPVPF